MEQLQVTATFPAIAPENLADFKRLAADILALTASEAGLLQYDWFFSPDETRCLVRETYASSNAVLAHLANVGDRLGTMVELGGGLEVDMFGDPSAELREAAAAFQPAVYAFFQGK